MLLRNRVRVRTGIRCDDECECGDDWVARALVTTGITVLMTAVAEVVVDRLKSPPPAEEPKPKARR